MLQQKDAKVPQEINQVDRKYQMNNEYKISAVSHESDVSLLQEVHEGAVNVSNAADKCFRVQSNSACDIDIAAQDAVLREQVCLHILMLVEFKYLPVSFIQFEFFGICLH